MIVGIDLGTTNSLIGYFKDGTAHVIPNRFGDFLTPSIVSIEDEEHIYIGKTAMERMYLYPAHTASVFKRNMGTEKEYLLNKRPFTAEELSSFIILNLKQDAEAYLGEPVTEAIISVPAYFNDARRKATKRAGELAGLKVERIISEPTAAAIAYGLYQAEQNAKFLVFDLGGGTFDVSVLERFENILEVRAVAGDNYLGGEDFTDVIVQFFYQETGLIPESVDRKTSYLLRQEAERVKHSLSEKSSVDFCCNVNGVDYKLPFDNQKFEQLCEDLFERLRQPIKRSLNDANVSLSAIDKLVLIGGATKMTIIRNFASRLFKKFPDTSINPDEAVCIGAALQGAMKERNEDIKEVILTDVCSYTLGTEISVERWDSRMEPGHFCPIIERNTVIPASRTERLYTIYDNQTKIRVKILQGESRFASNNILLGELTVSIPPAKAGKEAVDVTYTYDINSILEVQVAVVSTGKVTKCIIKGNDNSLSEEEIEMRLQELSYLKIAPREQDENKFVLTKAERLYEESTGPRRYELMAELSKFEAALDSQDKTKIAAARNELKEYLDKIDSGYRRF